MKCIAREGRLYVGDGRDRPALLRVPAEVPFSIELPNARRSASRPCVLAGAVSRLGARLFRRFTRATAARAPAPPLDHLPLMELTDGRDVTEEESRPSPK